MGSIIKGLFGFGSKPKIATPAPVKETADIKSGDIDPKRSEAIAGAKKKRLTFSRRTGRTALRVNLDDSKVATRSGISIA